MEPIEPMEPLIERFNKMSTPSRAHLLFKFNEINLQKLNKRINANNNVAPVSFNHLSQPPNYFLNEQHQRDTMTKKQKTITGQKKFGDFFKKN